MIDTTSVLGRAVSAAANRHDPASGRDRQRPRTQDMVPVIDARDDVLILRDGSVVAGVGVSSVDDALLTDDAVKSKLLTYRNDLLKQLRFDVQLLIGTRPQNLDDWHRKLFESAQRLQAHEERLYALADGLETYLAQEVLSRERFRHFFGFDPDDLYGVPGQVHEIAVLLTGGNVQILDGERDPAHEIERSAALLTHWQALIDLRAKFVARYLASNPRPVRMIYFITSFYPRIAGKVVSKLKGPLTEVEIAESKRTLDHRCSQLLRGLERMAFVGWRATHEELVRDIQYFYHPSQAYLAARELRADRSVSLRMVRAQV